MPNFFSLKPGVHRGAGQGPPTECQTCLHSSQEPTDGPCGVPQVESAACYSPTARGPNRGSADSPQSAREVGSSTAPEVCSGAQGAPSLSELPPSTAWPSTAVISLQTAPQAPRKPDQLHTVLLRHREPTEGLGRISSTCLVRHGLLRQPVYGEGLSQVPGEC